MITSMTKVRIVGAKTLMPKIVESLHSMKIIHIIEKSKETGLDIGQPMANANELSESLVKLRSMTSQLKIPLKTTPKKPDSIRISKEKIKGILTEVGLTAEEAKLQFEKTRESDEKIQNHTEILKKLQILKDLDLDLESIQEYQSIESLIGYIKNTADLKGSLSLKTTKFYLKDIQIEKKKELIALIIDKKYLKGAKSLLSDYDFSPIDFEDINTQAIKYGFKTVSTMTKEIKKELELAKAENSDAAKNLAVLKKEKEKNFQNYAFILSRELEKAQAPLKFQETEETFVIYGFIPKKRLNSTIKKLNEISNNKILIDIQKLDPKDKVPIALKNPKPIDNFKFFLDLYSLPNYREIDPSWFLFLTFPLLFGFMLGDVGYGLTTLIIFWLLKKKMPKFASFFNIVIFASLATIFFGAIFGEFFGIEPYHPLINRNPEHNLMPLMIIAVIIGIIHINAGLITGFVNEFRTHGFKKAFLEKFGWIFLQLSVALIAIGYTKILPISPVVGYAALVGSVYMLYKGEGIRGLVEIPGIFGNILSYVRLMAIGLSSVGLAMVVNNMAGGFFAAGGFSIIFGVIILVIGHLINLGIGLLGSFLHSLRLHYVELFSKFYEGGGIRFKPFGVDY